MGAGYSVNEDPRTVKISKDEETGAYSTVNVTEDVLRRLRDGGTTDSRHKGTSDSPQQPQYNVEDDSVKKAFLEERSLNQRLRHDLDETKAQMRALTAKLKQEQAAKGDASPTLNLEYTEKMEQLKAQQERLQEEMKSEFNSAVDRVSSRFFAHGVINENVCSGVESDVIRCYLDHPKTTLKCAPIAQEFNKCVDSYRYPEYL